MILRDELYPIGTAVKTHGLRGELSVVLDDEAPDTEDLRHVVLCVDGIYVPFSIASQRPRGTQGLLLVMDGVDTADEAAQYAGLEIFAPKKELPEEFLSATDDEDGLYAEDLEGFDVFTPDGRSIGRISEVDTTTINTLLTVCPDKGAPVLIPLAEDWIMSLDPDRRLIVMNIPDELLSI